MAAAEFNEHDERLFEARGATLLLRRLTLLLR
jgi:preprotein translocase subunit SecG